MVKHLRFLMLLFMVITYGGVSLAQDVTLDFTQNTWKLPTDYTTTAATYTDGTYKISFGKSSNGHKFGGSYLIFGKSGATLSLPAFDFDVEKIVVTGNKSASGKVKQNIFVGDKAASTETTGAQGTNTYEIAEAYQAAGNVYTLKVLSSHNTQVTKIEIYKKGGATKTSTTVSFGENYDGKTISLKPGDEFTAPTATLTPAKAGSLTYSSSDEKVATVDATGAVTLTGTTGKTTITAAFEGNDTYAASKASYTLNVAEALSLTGDGSKENPYTVADALAIVNAGQQTTDNVYVKGIVSSVDKFYSNYGSIDYYIVDKEGDTESIMAYNSKGLNEAQFSSINDLTVGTTLIVCGTLTKYKDIVELGRGNYIEEILSQGTEKTPTTVTFRDGNDKIYYEKVGGTFNYPTATLDPEEAGKLTYTSSNPDVATVNAQTGEVTLSDKNTGSTIITAAFAGSDKYEASKASYTIVVSDPSVQTKNATFDFTLPGNYNKGTSNSDDSTAGDMAEGESIRQDDVTLTVTTNGSPSTRFWKSTDKIDFRIYNGAKLTLSVPDGYIISSVVTDPTDPQQTIGDVNQQNVELTYTGTVKLNNMTVVYAKVPETGVTVDMDEYGYVTLYYSDRALKVPEGAKALTYKVSDKGLEVSREYAAGKVIPADEAVVISAAEGKYTFKFADGALLAKDPDNKLLGTDETKLIEGDATANYFYKLSLDDNHENIGFYWGDADGGLFANQAHKAYLVVLKSQAKAAKFFSLGGNGETTGIDAIESEKASANAPVFNLSGQRVDNSYKGIVIKNGKKFMKK